MDGQVILKTGEKSMHSNRPTLSTGRFSVEIVVVVVVVGTEADLLFVISIKWPIVRASMSLLGFCVLS